MRGVSKPGKTATTNETKFSDEVKARLTDRTVREVIGDTHGRR